MTHDRSLERAARSFIEIGPTAAPPQVVDEALRVIEHTTQERDWFPWRFPRMTLPARVAAIVVVGALLIAGSLALIGTGASDPGPLPGASPSPQSSAPAGAASPSVAPAHTAIARPSAPLDRRTAVTIATDFMDAINAGRLEAAADLVWVGATISHVPMTNRDQVLGALATTCGFEFGPQLSGGGNTVTWEGWLKDRADYACPQVGLGVRTRIVVENGLVVEFVPIVASGQSP